MEKYKLIIILLLSFGTLYSQAQDDTTFVKEKKEKISFRDPLDNAFDVSSFLLEHKGVLPVPLFITEPALGYGGGVTLLYFHKRKKKHKVYVPPNVSGVFGMATQNGTFGFGAFHMHTFGENRVRTMTSIAKPNVNINYYGNNNDILSENPVLVKFNSWVIFQRAQVRICPFMNTVYLKFTFLNFLLIIYLIY